MDAGPWLPQCVQAEDEAEEYYFGRGLREPEDEEMTSKFLGPRDLPRVDATREKIAHSEAFEDGALSPVPLNPPEFDVGAGSSADGAVPLLAQEDTPTYCPESNVGAESLGELAAPLLVLQDGSANYPKSPSPSPSPPRVVPPRERRPKQRATPHQPRVVPRRVWEPAQRVQQWWWSETWDSQDAWASWHWDVDWQRHWWA